MYIQKVDMKTYPRKAHFDLFLAMGYPYVGLTSNTVSALTGMVSWNMNSAGLPIR